VIFFAAGREVMSPGARAFVVVVLALEVASCSMTTCSTVGCRRSLRIDVPLALAYADVRASMITVCRNDECVGSALAGLPETAPQPFGGFGIVFPADAAARRNSSCVLIAWSDHLDVECQPYQPDDVHDGDHYRMTLTDAGGAVVASVDRTVTYTVSFPNGEECGPTCQNVELEAAAP
jgi:hypothetical protein